MFGLKVGHVQHDEHEDKGDAAPNEACVEESVEPAPAASLAVDGIGDVKAANATHPQVEEDLRVDLGAFEEESVGGTGDGAVARGRGEAEDGHGHEDDEEHANTAGDEQNESGDQDYQEKDSGPVETFSSSGSGLGDLPGPIAKELVGVVLLRDPEAWIEEFRGAVDEEFGH